MSENSKSFADSPEFYKLSPLLLGFEVVRKSYFSRLGIYCVISSILLIAGSFFLARMSDTGFAVKFILLVLCSLGVLVFLFFTFLQIFKSKLWNYTRSKIAPALINLIGNDYKRSDNDFVKFTNEARSCNIPNKNPFFSGTCEATDVIFGKMNNKPFSVYCAYFPYKQTNYRKPFGTGFIFDCISPSQGQIQISVEETHLKNSLYRKLNLSLVRLPDSLLPKDYVVYAPKDVKVEHFLNVDLQKRISKFCELTNDIPDFVIRNGKLEVMCHSVFYSFTYHLDYQLSEAAVKNTCRGIQDVFDLVDVMTS